jgi:uncharacterized cupin superfamily protein
MNSKRVADIIVFQQHALTAEQCTPPAERVLGGSCRQQVENHYSDPSGQFHAGVWSGEQGRWRVHYTEHEFCTMIKGKVKLSDDQGAELILRAGDFFVIPAGFEGVWEVLEPASKTYAIFEARP